VADGSCVGKVWNGREAKPELKMFPPNDEVYWLVAPPQDPLRSCLVPETVPMAPCVRNGWCKISGTYEINYGAGGTDAYVSHSQDKTSQWLEKSAVALASLNITTPKIANPRSIGIVSLPLPFITVPNGAEVQIA
jgi:hypothetical protein